MQQMPLGGVTPQGNAFEGLPIYLVPGASTLPALQATKVIGFGFNLLVGDYDQTDYGICNL